MRRLEIGVLQPRETSVPRGLPKNLNDSLSQCKRWIVGLLEVAFSKYNPLIFGTRKASLLLGMYYSHYAFWPIWSIPVTVYAMLPQLALLFDSPLFPKLSDPWFYLYAYLFLAAYFQDLLEFLMADGTIQKWWSDQRMWMIRCLTSFPFGSIEFAINQMGLSSPGFNLTSKVSEDGQNERYDKGIFDFWRRITIFYNFRDCGHYKLELTYFGSHKCSKRRWKFRQIVCAVISIRICSGELLANCQSDVCEKRRRENAEETSILVGGIICAVGYFGLID